MHGNWDVRIEGPAPGEVNMARDEALANEAAASGRALLRLYAWLPPAVSIGRNQDAAEACAPAACRALGWDVVRRPTGGRAVCHDRDEVTYAVALPAAAAPPGVLAAYEWLAQGLLAGYRALGLPAELAPRRPPPDPSGDPGRRGACFDAPAPSEIVCAGRKLAGSAQVRRAGYLLQHGSLPMHVDTDLHARLLGLSPEASAALARRAAGIADLLRPAPSWAEVAAAIAAGFRQALDPGAPNRAPAGRGPGGDPLASTG